MTDQAAHIVISATEPKVPAEAGARHTNLRTSRQIARFLAIVVILFVLTSVGFAFWITREHNRLAGTSSEQMVRGGFTALEETLNTVTMDFAIWPEAVNAINSKNLTWVWENIGVSAAVTGTTDLMLIVPPRGEEPYGWAPGSGESPRNDLISPEFIELMRRLLDPVETASRRPVSTFVRSGDQVWLLSSARMVSDDPTEDPDNDDEIPRLIFGFELDADKVTDIGIRYLIRDLKLTDNPGPNVNSIEILDSKNKAVSLAAWSPPRPGDEILRRIAVPLAFGLGLLTLLAFVSSGLLSRSARRLEATLQAAQAASRAKSDFIANISHELRTPMNGIMGLTTLIQQTELDSKQSNMLQMLRSSAETQMNLIGDLLEMSSIENGHITLSMAPFSPAKIIRSVCDIFEIEAANKGLELKLEIGDAAQATVIGDAERYRQICANIVSNAVKFTASGEVRVRLNSRALLEETVFTFEVTDTGPGIDPSDHEQIFERFAQGRSQAAGKASGTGLGLAITKSITELMGGKLNVISKVGEGASFVVEIPFESASGATSAK